MTQILHLISFSELNPVSGQDLLHDYMYLCSELQLVDAKYTLLLSDSWRNMINRNYKGFFFLKRPNQYLTARYSMYFAFRAKSFPQTQLTDVFKKAIGKR